MWTLPRNDQSKVNLARLDLMGGEKRYNLRKEEMIAANIADVMVIYLFTILLITLLSPVGINDLIWYSLNHTACNPICVSRSIEISC